MFRFDANIESLKQYTAKLGIYAHWGIYSVPVAFDEWYPRKIYDSNSEDYQYHRKVWGEQSVFGYKDFIPMFRGEKWDPEYWADLYRPCMKSLFS